MIRTLSFAYSLMKLTAIIYNERCRVWDHIHNIECLLQLGLPLYAQHRLWTMELLPTTAVIFRLMPGAQHWQYSISPYNLRGRQFLWTHMKFTVFIRI